MNNTHLQQLIEFKVAKEIGFHVKHHKSELNAFELQKHLGEMELRCAVASEEKKLKLHMGELISTMRFFKTYGIEDIPGTAEDVIVAIAIYTTNKELKDNFNPRGDAAIDTEIDLEEKNAPFYSKNMSAGNYPTIFSKK